MNEPWMRIVQALGLLLVLSVPAGAWEYRLHRTDTAGGLLCGTVDAISVDPHGDVLAGGRAYDDCYDSDGKIALIVKLDGTTGLERWRQDTLGGDALGSVESIAIDGAGAVVAAASVRRQDEPIAVVVKLDDTTGAIIWRRELEPRTQAVVTPTDDILIVTPTRTLLLDGASGTERWVRSAGGRRLAIGAGVAAILTDVAVGVINLGDGSTRWEASLPLPGPFDVGVGGDGNVVVAGRRLEGWWLVRWAADGVAAWTRVVDGTENGYLFSFGLDQDANPILAGARNGWDGRLPEDLLVVATDAVTGRERFRSTTPGRRAFRDHGALAFTSDGDVITTGDVDEERTGEDTVVLRVDGTTATLAWRWAIDGSLPRMTSQDGGRVVAVDANDDVLVGGAASADDQPYLFVVMKRSGASGGDAPCGNGRLDPGEECDDGNPATGDSCDPNCRVPGCGNGYTVGPEECDDGNTVDTDQCSARCALQPPCGNVDVHGRWIAQVWCEHGPGSSSVVDILDIPGGGPFVARTPDVCGLNGSLPFRLDGSICVPSDGPHTIAFASDGMELPAGGVYASTVFLSTPIMWNACRVATIVSTHVLTATLVDRWDTDTCEMRGEPHTTFTARDAAGIACGESVGAKCFFAFYPVEGASTLPPTDPPPSVDPPPMPACLNDADCIDGDPCTVRSCGAGGECQTENQSETTTTACRLRGALNGAGVCATLDRGRGDVRLLRRLRRVLDVLAAPASSSRRVPILQRRRARLQARLGGYIRRGAFPDDCAFELTRLLFPTR